MNYCNNESTVNVIELRDTEQRILNFMLLSMKNFKYIKEKLIPHDFTYTIHKMIFRNFCKREEYFTSILCTDKIDINELDRYLENFSDVLSEKYNVKKLSTLNILSKTPSINIENDLNYIKFLSEEKKLAFLNRTDDSLIKFIFEDIESYTVGRFIQNKIVEIVTTNIESLPSELCDTADGTMIRMSEIDIKNMDNEISFSPPESEPIGTTVFHIKKNVSLLERKEFEIKEKFEILFEWANKYNLDAKVFPRNISELKKIDKLEVSNMNIKELPKELILLEKLIFIDAGFNKLKSIPKEFVDFRSLILFNLEFNEFEVFPKEVLNLNKLEFLSLKSNNINEIPIAINQLKNLKCFCLCKNNIKEIPNKLSELSNLENFCIHRNKLDFIFKDISKLKKLEVFSFSNNNIQSLPVEIAELSNLKSLEFENNNIDNIDLDILKLPKLSKLAFNDNLFKYISENMNSLNNIDTINLSESALDEESDLVKKLSFSLDYDSWIDSEDKKENGCVKLLNSKEQNNDN